MQSIKLTGKSKKRFCYFYLVPDSKALAEECTSASNDCKAKMIMHYTKIMTLGCPNHFNAFTTYENSLLYWWKGNLPIHH